MKGINLLIAIHKLTNHMHLILYKTVPWRLCCWCWYVWVGKGSCCCWCWYHCCGGMGRVLVPGLPTLDERPLFCWSESSDNWDRASLAAFSEACQNRKMQNKQVSHVCTYRDGMIIGVSINRMQGCGVDSTGSIQFQ